MQRGILLSLWLLFVLRKEVLVFCVICRRHNSLDTSDGMVGNKTVECEHACFAMWQHYESHVTVMQQGCMTNQNNDCQNRSCELSANRKLTERFCCCTSDRCNVIQWPGVKVSFRRNKSKKDKNQNADTKHQQPGPDHATDTDESETDDYEYEDKQYNSNHGYKFESSSDERPHKKQVNTAKSTEKPEKQIVHCAHHSNNDKINIREVKHDDSTASSTASSESSSSSDGEENRVRCDKINDSCYTLWSYETINDTQTVIIIKQGCWQSRPEDNVCFPDVCTSSAPVRNDNANFCCCYGNMCNVNFSDGYDPSLFTTVNPLYPASSIIRDDTYSKYKEKTIIISLVSVSSVALITVGLYLLYRMCISAHKPIPDQLNLTEAPPSPGFSMEDLKIMSQICKTKNGEVWKGTLHDVPVAVKVFIPNHKQLFQNEVYIYSLPFIEHENLLKFYGADEKMNPDGFMQYFIVLSYAPQGSLYGYLKNNTLDWSLFCKMCLSITKGLTHLHTDIRKGDLFKPTIAHRDLNTRNILVKDDLTCVIGDLGFAITAMGSKLIKNGVIENAEQASLQDVGTLRYMAPELLDGAANLRESEASLKQIDVYALGLVLWEVATRCVDLYHGVPLPDYLLPYQVEAGLHPTFEEMQILVSRNKVRPKFSEVWRDSNQAVRALKETIDDCWDHDAEARLTAMCVEERLFDMMSIWAQDSKNKGVTPTITTSNLFADIALDNTQSGLAEDDDIGNVSATMVTVNELSANSMNDSSTANFVITSPPNGYVSNDGHRPLSWRGRGITASASTTETLLPLSPSEEEPPQKLLNSTLAKNNTVLPPHQGRNPTVERNTHKRSDEEIAVSGNKLVYNNERRGSDSVQSAPPLHDDLFENFSDNLETSLVQSDVLSHHRNPPIPHLQNQVHGDHGVVRPKVANLPSTNPLLQNSSGHQRDGRQNKSKLGKLIKVKDIGSKLSQIALFAKRASKSHNRNKNENRSSQHMLDNVEQAQSDSLLLSNQLPGENLHLTNQNIDHSVQLSNQIGANQYPTAADPIQTEVRIRKGSAVVRPANLSQNSDLSSGNLGRGSENVGHDNQLCLAEVGVAKLQSQPTMGQRSVVKVRRGPYSKSTSDLSPPSELKIKRFSETGFADSFTRLKRPNSLSLRGHNYKNKAPTKSNTCENFKIVLQNSRRESSDKVEALSRSNSREKIKRRVKTPVVVKHGRFSLYDDRLMTQFIIDNSDSSECMEKTSDRRKSSGSLQYLIENCDSNANLYSTVDHNC